MENAGSRSSPKKFGNGGNRQVRDNNRPSAGGNAEAGGKQQSSEASGKIYNSRNTGAQHFIPLQKYKFPC
jgi:hypothetical protein